MLYHHSSPGEKKSSKKSLKAQYCHESHGCVCELQTKVLYKIFKNLFEGDFRSVSEGSEKIYIFIWQCKCKEKWKWVRFVGLRVSVGSPCFGYWLNMWLGLVCAYIICLQSIIMYAGNTAWGENNLHACFLSLSLSLSCTWSLASCLTQILCSS